MDHLVIAATAEGLGTCWVAANDSEKIRTTLKMQEYYEFVALTPLGVPAKHSSSKSGKKLNEIIKRV